MIGTKTQGSTAILVGASAGAVVNSGDIYVNGAANALPSVNYGIDVQSATNVTNSGTVRVRDRLKVDVDNAIVGGNAERGELGRCFVGAFAALGLAFGEF